MMSTEQYNREYLDTLKSSRPTQRDVAAKRREKRAPRKPSVSVKGESTLEEEKTRDTIDNTKDKNTKLAQLQASSYNQVTVAKKSSQPAAKNETKSQVTTQTKKVP